MVRVRCVSRFKFLFTYLFVFLLEHLSLLSIPIHTVLYANVYYLFQGLNLVVACGVIHEIYHLALADHPALASFGDSVIVWAVGFALAVTVLSLTLDHEVLPGQFTRV